MWALSGLEKSLDDVSMDSIDNILPCTVFMQSLFSALLIQPHLMSEFQSLCQLMSG